MAETWARPTTHAPLRPLADGRPFRRRSARVTDRPGSAVRSRTCRCVCIPADFLPRRSRQSLPRTVSRVPRFRPPARTDRAPATADPASALRERRRRRMTRTHDSQPSRCLRGRRTPPGWCPGSGPDTALVVRALGRPLRE